jgi:hypothetical protein
MSWMEYVWGRRAKWSSICFLLVDVVREILAGGPSADASVAAGGAVWMLVGLVYVKLFGECSSNELLQPFTSVFESALIAIGQVLRSDSLRRSAKVHGDILNSIAHTTDLWARHRAVSSTFASAIYALATPRE